MPGEKCARCGKTVYVVEKLACLDQVWHKWCFNCEVCHTTLTMKNYQAIGGKPYCRVHYPAPGASEDGKDGLDFQQDKAATEGTYENDPEPEPEQYVGQADTGEFDNGATGEEVGYAEEGYAEEGYAEEYAEEGYGEEEEYYEEA